jgi:hypothetical protein
MARRSTTERKFFPGYVLVEMIMDDDTWHLVKHTNKVTGFVGGAKNRPSPISQAEVAKIVNQMQEGTEKPRHKVEFEVGEYVRVKDGPFTDFNGTVEDVNYDKSKVVCRSRFSAVPRRSSWSSPDRKDLRSGARTAGLTATARSLEFRIFRLGADVVAESSTPGSRSHAPIWPVPGVMYPKGVNHGEKNRRFYQAASSSW